MKMSNITNNPGAGGFQDKKVSQNNNRRPEPYGGIVMGPSSEVEGFELMDENPKTAGTVIGPIPEGASAASIIGSSIQAKLKEVAFKQKALLDTLIESVGGKDASIEQMGQVQDSEGNFSDEWNTLLESHPNPVGFVVKAEDLQRLISPEQDFELIKEETIDGGFVAEASKVKEFIQGLKNQVELRGYDFAGAGPSNFIEVSSPEADQNIILIIRAEDLKTAAGHNAKTGNITDDNSSVE